MDEILIKIGELIQNYFGIKAEEIMNGDRSQNISDARTAYAFVLYDNNLMNGVEIGKHIGCTSRAVYYHLQKYKEMKSNRLFSFTLKQFESEVSEEVKLWAEKHII